MAGTYKNFLKLLKQWPPDTSKRGRDIGHKIQEEVKKGFSSGALSVADEGKCAKVLASLSRLCNNYHGNLYQRTLKSSATAHLAQSLGKQPCSVLHTPVLANEVVNVFCPKDREVYVDMTFGAGGHTAHLLKAAPDIKIFALDRDPVAHEIAIEFAKKYPNNVTPLLGKFSDLPSLLQIHNVKQNSIDGFLFDLGCSSMQFDQPHRGFSVSKEGPLDMRMDGNNDLKVPTAADVLACIDEYDLARILSVYGEEKKAKKIARAVIESRYTFKTIRTTRELAEFVAAVTEDDIRLDKLERPAHVATKTFQALRIFVNNEINELNYGLHIAHKYTKFGGKIVILSFHSLEDRVVKGHLVGSVNFPVPNIPQLKLTDPNFWYEKDYMENARANCWESLHKHVVVPSIEEVEENPRSRSAKLRAAIKIR